MDLGCRFIIKNLFLETIAKYLASSKKWVSESVNLSVLQLWRGDEMIKNELDLRESLRVSYDYFNRHRQKILSFSELVDQKSELVWHNKLSIGTLRSVWRTNIRVILSRNTLFAKTTNSGVVVVWSQKYWKTGVFVIDQDLLKSSNGVWSTN